MVVGSGRVTDARALPPGLFMPFLTVLLVWRAVMPVLVLTVFASVLRPPGSGDRQALLWLGLLATVMLLANLGLLAWVRRSDRHREWIRHPAFLVMDVAVMVLLLMANAAVLPQETFLLEARDVFNAYVWSTAALWTYLRSPWVGVAIVAVAALAQGAGIVVNGYPLAALGSAKAWIRQVWGPVAVVLIWALAIIVGRAVAEQREGARLRAEAARERAEMAAMARAHDEVLPFLAEIVRASETHERPQDQLERVRRLAQQADDVIREGFQRQRSPSGAVREGVAELVHKCRERQRATARPARLQIVSADAEPSLPAEHRKTLLAATQQALHNAEEHARADTITVSIEADEQEVRVIVADDGAGFDPATIARDRFGVRGSIQDRMASIGGRAVLDTAPGQGCMWELAVRHDEAPPPESGVGE